MIPFLLNCWCFIYLQGGKVPRSKSCCIYYCHVPISFRSHVWWLGTWYMLVTWGNVFHNQGKETLQSGNFALLGWNRLPFRVVSPQALEVNSLTLYLPWLSHAQQIFSQGFAAPFPSSCAEACRFNDVCPAVEICTRITYQEPFYSWKLLAYPPLTKQGVGPWQTYHTYQIVGPYAWCLYT